MQAGGTSDNEEVRYSGNPWDTKDNRKQRLHQLLFLDVELGRLMFHDELKVVCYYTANVYKQSTVKYKL